MALSQPNMCLDMTDAERAVREAHTTCFNCVGEVGLRDESEFNVDCHVHHAAIDRAIEAVKRGRDVAMEGFIQDAYKQGKLESDAAFKAGNKDAYETGRRDENEAIHGIIDAAAADYLLGTDLGKLLKAKIRARIGRVKP